MIQILTIPLVCSTLGIGRTKYYDDTRERLLPKPVSRGSGIGVGVPSDEIEAIRDARIGGATDEEIRELVLELEAQREIAWLETKQRIADRKNIRPMAARSQAA